MRSLKGQYIKNAQLGISAIIVLSAGLMYGLHPSKILPIVFGFEVQDLELKNIFRAIMGLYLVLGIYWIIGIIKPKHWQTATIINVLFMGGLAFGRIISTIFDGISSQYMIGLILELLFMIWGIYNLKSRVPQHQKS
ncbi:DUF4345 domain-containing protein [Dokdonia sp.]|uniref:DUF4345 domain-containing protein n=1 Tax=Dokdonia sp. TaxID=2024995 RepID=UPI003262DBEE